MNLLLILGISLANNLDNTGVGVAYGVGRIRLSPSVNLWIAAITFVITGCAGAFGHLLLLFLPLRSAQYISAVILSVIGIGMLMSARKPQSNEKIDNTNRLRQILESPDKADIDHSHHIDFAEGTLLGIALSINNVGGGISAGLMHLNVIWTALVSAILSFLVLWLGGIIGRRAVPAGVARYSNVLSGLILIAIGLYQLR